MAAKPLLIDTMAVTMNELRLQTTCHLSWRSMPSTQKQKTRADQIQITKVQILQASATAIFEYKAKAASTFRNIMEKYTPQRPDLCGELEIQKTHLLATKGRCWTLKIVQLAVSPAAKHTFLVENSCFLIKECTKAFTLKCENKTLHDSSIIDRLNIMLKCKYQ